MRLDAFGGGDESLYWTNHWLVEGYGRVADEDEAVIIPLFLS